MRISPSREFDLGDEYGEGLSPSYRAPQLTRGRIVSSSSRLWGTAPADRVLAHFLLHHTVSLRQHSFLVL